MSSDVFAIVITDYDRSTGNCSINYSEEIDAQGLCMTASVSGSCPSVGLDDFFKGGVGIVVPTYLDPTSPPRTYTKFRLTCGGPSIAAKIGTTDEFLSGFVEDFSTPSPKLYSFASVGSSIGPFNNSTSYSSLNMTSNPLPYTVKITVKGT